MRSRYHGNFWITTIGSLSNDDGDGEGDGDGDGNENGKKANVLISKTTTLHVRHTFFVHFLAVVARLRHETS